MALEQERYEHIEAYLDGSMHADERHLFEQALADSEELRQTLDLHREMDDTYRPSPKDDLRVNLGRIGESFDENGLPLNASVKTSGKLAKIWPWLLSVLVIGVIVAYVCWPSFTEVSAVPDTPSSTELPPPPRGIDEEMPPVDDIRIPAQEETPSTTSQKKTPLPIAANYAPNPRLESEIGSFLRGDFQFEFKSPLVDEKLSAVQGKVSVAFSGLLETTLVPNEDFAPFLEIYTNIPHDFEQGSYILREPLGFTTEESPYVIQQAFEFPATGGLYYYLVKDDFSGAVLGGGRLFVKKE